VLASLGTVQFTNDAFFKMVMATFADYPGQFVLAAGPNTDPARLGTPPANFIVQPTYPQLPLLERAAAFITHGGLGGVHEGLWQGVPMVAVPQHFEQLRNALAAGREGAAIILDDQVYGRPIEGGALKAALDKVISHPSYRQNATRLGATLRAGGGYVTVAKIIEEVVAH
jgi:MGT family glycosyltransferase